MAKLTELSVKTSRKVGLPGFSSVFFEASASSTFEQGIDDVKQAYRDLWAICRDQIDSQLKEWGEKENAIA